MNTNEKRWNPSFVSIIQQRNRALRPGLLKAQGKRLYQIKNAPDKGSTRSNSIYGVAVHGKRLYQIKNAPDKGSIHPHPIYGSSVYGKLPAHGKSYGGMKGEIIASARTGRGYSIGVRVERVEIKWISPKQATLLRLQGATVDEVSEDTPEGVHTSSYAMDFEI